MAKKPKGYTRAGQQTMKADYGASAGQQVSLTRGLTAGDINAKIIITQDNTAIIEGAINAAVKKALEKIGWTCEGYAKRLCPVDTGRLRNSIAHQLMNDEDAVIIGTNVEYGPYVELGTSRQREQPYLRPAAQNNEDEWNRIMERELKGQ